MSAQVICACGSTMFLLSYKTGGRWKILVDSRPNGKLEHIESDTDNVRNGEEPKTMKCAECGKRVPNPRHTS